MVHEPEDSMSDTPAVAATTDHRIAVVGMACRVPGAPDHEAFWQLLREGRESVTAPPAGRGIDGAFRGGFLDRVDGFDPGFFGMSPREAAAADPQQRLALELCWQALEDAGVRPGLLRGTGTGVFIGSMSDDYAKLQHREGTASAHSMTGLSRAVIANRLSYLLGLTGPSLAVDTAQSSSLAAVHLAVRSLRSGESEVALAGGVHLNLLAEEFTSAELFGALSPGGRCHTFDARADGFVRGEGGAVLVLKPLPKALADGDRVHGVLLGSALGNGAGHTLTAPEPTAQERVLRAAYEDAGVSPTGLQYVELHGTGTRLGDPVEAAALGAALGAVRPAEDPLRVGSVKTNIGHLEGAAGVVGLVKALLCVKHRELAPSLNFTHPHPGIPLDELRLAVQQTTSPWPHPEAPLLAGVSSFGMGGTNCHVVLADPESAGVGVGVEVGGSSAAGLSVVGSAGVGATSVGSSAVGSSVSDSSVPDSSAVREALPWLVSARSAAALRAQAAQLLAKVESADVQPGPAELADLAGSLATTRSAFEHRAAVLVEDHGSLLSGLAALAGGRGASNVLRGVVPRGETEAGGDEASGQGTGKVAFLFSGQGSQHPGMGRELYDAFPLFATALDEVAAALDPELASRLTAHTSLPVVPLREVMFAGSDTEHATLLQQTAYTQPALFALEVALHRLLTHWEITPDLLLGHSLGEITAAHLAGVLDLRDAAVLVTTRAALMQAQPTGGAMTALQATEDETIASLPADGTVTIAAVNGPTETVISGDHDAVHALATHWASQGRKTTHLHVSHAFHSPHMDGMLDTFRNTLRTLTFHAPTTPLISNITGELATTAELSDPDYWTHHVRTTVRFHHGLTTLHTHHTTTYLELGPGHALTQLATHASQSTESTKTTALPLLRRKHPEVRSVLATLAELHTQGSAVGWDQLCADAGTRRVDLPTYPFQRSRHWLDESASAPGLGTAADAAPEVPRGEQRSGSESEQGPGHSPSVSSPSDPGAPLPRPGELLDLVREQTAAVLGYASAGAVDTDWTFRDLGLDSYGTVELRDRLARLSGRDLPSTVLFNHPTPGDMARWLHTQLSGEDATAPAAGGPGSALATADDPIVIVGMACRYPGGVSSPAELWRLLREEQHALGSFPEDRGWDLAALHDADPDRAGTSYARSGSFLDDVAGFDAEFFGISPREALAMDPQQRLLLETAWEAFERAGIETDRLRGSRTGTFVGATTQDYGPRMYEAEGGLDGYVLTGTTPSVASGRLSYVFGLEGPAVTVDTACSSSLVALHLAAQSLRNGECDLALAGGVTVLSTPGMFIEFSRQRGLAADGRCKSFAAAADGTGWAEGVGLLLVERLSDARRKGHRVLAVVRGTAVNQDGASNGLTAPNGQSQERLIRTALTNSGLTAADVDAVEAHGTGTKLGDPIEAQALLATYGQDRPEERPLWLGSVKSNIGHTQAAAGVAGIIKMVQAIQHGQLPATLHVDEPTPHVDWSSGGVQLLTEQREWPALDRPRRAAVSSFGISGTNAHVILEQAPKDEGAKNEGAEGESPADELLESAGALDGTAGSGSGPDSPSTPASWLLSGHTAQALRDAAQRLLTQVTEQPDLEASAVADALNRRARFPHRAAVIGTGRDELLAGLAAVAEGSPHSNVVTGTAREGKTVFVFPGQGSQWVGMGVQLLATSPVFTKSMEECAQALAPFTDWNLLEVLDDADALGRVDVVQPATWAVMVSLARWWQDHGIHPDAVIGHSQGEIAAAHIAGALSLEDAARVVALRSKALTTLAGTGGMMSLALSAEQAGELIASYGDDLHLAALNSPTSTVVAGTTEALDNLQQHCEAEGIRHRRIPVDYASHTPLVEPLRAQLAAQIGELTPRQSDIPFYSTVTTEPVDTTTLTTGYWFTNLRTTVHFNPTIQKLLTHGHTHYIETSPHPGLTAAIQEATDTDTTDTITVTTHATLLRGDDTPTRLHHALAHAHTHGLTPTAQPNSQPTTHHPDLPTYPFQHKRYWLAPAGSAGARPSGHPLLGAPVAVAGTESVLFDGKLGLSTHPWLADHAVSGTVLLPGTAMLEMALHAAVHVGCARLDDLTLSDPLLIPAGGTVQLQVTVAAPDAEGRRPVHLHSRPAEARTGAEQLEDTPWTLHAEGTLSPGAETPLAGVADTDTDPVWPPRDAEAVPLADGYARLGALGYDYGPVFQGLRTLWRRTDEVFAEVVLPEDVRQAAGPGSGGGFDAHPALLDAVLHAVLLGGTLAAPADSAEERALLPFAWSGVRLHAIGATAVRASVRPVGPDAVSLDLRDPAGGPVASVERLTFLPVAVEQLRARATARHDGLYRMDWAPLPVATASPTAAVPDTGTWYLLDAGASETRIPAPENAENAENTELSLATWGLTACTDLDSLAGQVSRGEIAAPDVVLVQGVVPVHDLALDRGPEGSSGAEGVRQSAARALELVRQWLGTEQFDGARLVFVTRGAMAVEPGEEVRDLAGAALWGLIRAAETENPGRFGLLDLDEEPESVRALPRAIGSGEPQLALRGGESAVPRLVRMPGSGESSGTGESADWDPEGTVLLTGGSGSLAALLAKHLVAEHGVRHLLLASRRGPGAEGADELRGELLALGAASVTLAACDLSEEGATRALVAAVPEARPLTAVVHLAGLLDDGPVTTLTPERLGRVLAPKVDAAWNLHHATRGLPLRAFLMFSSVAGTLGLAGQANYAAANAFLDAFAQRRRAEGLPAQSLAWGLWAQASGMTRHLAEADVSRMARQGLAAMDSAQGLALFDAALGTDAAHVVAARLSLGAFRTAAGAGSAATVVPPVLRSLVRTPVRRAATGAAPAAGTEFAARLAALSAAERDRETAELVRAQVSAVLGHSTAELVDPAKAFKELGFDSLTAVELRNRLAEATGRRLPTTLVFDYPSPEALAGYLSAEIGGSGGAGAASAAGNRARTAAGGAASRDLGVDSEPIALVGMACRYPGGIGSPEDLWRLVLAGQDGISEFPKDRGWDLGSLYHPDPDNPGTSSTKVGNFLHEAGEFDAEFFGISPREALAMDPQQRLLLETAWEAFERTGIDPLSLRGSRTGVFAGLMYHDYANGVSDAEAESVAGHVLTGTQGSVASGRLSYVFGLEGPAVTVDTACSSSLVALHLAAQSLRNGECDLALAGGATVMATPDTFVEFSRQRGLAADGRCKSFAAAADGTGWGEGVGLLLVERLSDARRNGHPVLAVVRSTAVNQDGASNGLTAPNGPSQQRVITTALQTAGLTGSDVDAVEAHGTGTKLGDPIEAQALLATYGQDRPEDRPLWLGSVKSNIGHTQAAAGVAGIIKMVQAIQHGQLPATLHVDEPTPHVDWSSGGVQLLTEQREWPTLDRPRRAAVSSFGISGTNAHVILEQAPDEAVVATTAAPKSGSAPTTDLNAPPLPVSWTLSGRSEEVLRDQAGLLRGYLREHAEVSAEEVAGALAHRSRFDHRAVLVGTSREELLTGLEALANGLPHPALTQGTAHDGKTVFVFPGQGSQWVGMGVQLLTTSPVFTKSMEECAQALAPFTDWNLLDVLDDADALARVDVVQPATWAVMVSLARWWQDHGIHPDAVIGHSQGEIAAAHIAGALSLEDAARVVALRSKALTTLAGTGGMMSLALSAEQAGELIAAYGDDLHLAALNSPTSTVVAGTTEALDALQQHCEAEGIRHRRIPVDYASHTPLVEPLRAQLAAQIGVLTPRQSDIPFYSTVTTEPVDTTTLTTDYWFTNLRTTVHFNPTIQKLLTHGHTHYIETSPHPGLTTAIQETTEAPENADTHTQATTHAHPPPRRRRHPTRLHHALAHAHTHGLTPTITTHSQPTTHHPDLPTYPFQHKRYWLASSAPQDQAVSAADDAFWASVEGADAEALAGRLKVPAEALGAVLPALSAWRRQAHRATALDDWRYQVSWQAAASGEASGLTGTWLAYTGAGAEPPKELMSALEAAGARTAHVPDLPELERRLREEPEIAGVLSLDIGTAATLALLKGLARGGVEVPVWHLTRQAVRAVPEDPAPLPEQAQVWGLGRVAALEYPRLWGGLVDLPGQPEPEAPEAEEAQAPGPYAELVRQLRGGGAAQDGEDQLAVRRTGAYARRLLRHPYPVATGSAPWRPRHTTLVTGGTGALGPHIARWLAEAGAERLVVTSRRGPLAEGMPELVAELQERGVDAEVVACDVADRSAVAGLVADLEARGHRIGTVVHAAALMQLNSLDGLTAEELDAVLEAKVAGARHLDELLAHHPVEAFVLFSSIAGVWGSGDHGAYAAANAHLDAFAEQRRARGLPATSVAWGVWGSDKLPDAVDPDFLRRQGLPLIDPETAFAGLQQALDHDETFVVLAEVDWARFVPVFASARRRPLLDTIPEVAALLTEEGPEAAAGTDRHPLVRRLSGLSPDAREEELLGLVQSGLAAVLGHEPERAEVPAKTPFKQLGVDSLLAVEVRNRLAGATGLKLPATLVYDHPSPGAVARFLLGELAAALSADGGTGEGQGGEPGRTAPVLSSVHSELDRLETVLASGGVEQAERSTVADRLRVLLAELDGPRTAVQDESDDLDDLDLVDDEDMFDLIDKELGGS
nr:PKS I [Streptomyces sp.]